jgi:hypothetical protein
VWPRCANKPSISRVGVANDPAKTVHVSSTNYPGLGPVGGLWWVEGPQADRQGGGRILQSHDRHRPVAQLVILQWRHWNRQRLSSS